MDIIAITVWDVISLYALDSQLNYIYLSCIFIQRKSALNKTFAK